VLQSVAFSCETTIARHLLTRAQENTDFPMPVVFNLSSWPGMRLSIKDWLVQELYIKYQVAREIGHHWVTTQQMLLLLDGLDEVGNDRRNHCVQALNQFMQEYGETELVVCCRTNDYEVLTQRLRLQGAVFIQPLTPPQVQTYLNSLGEDFITLRKAIDADPTLQELTKSPLLLSMMTLSYQGFNFDVFPKLSDLDAYREHLFETYVQRMWRCRRNHRYSLQRSQHWFAWLAFHLDRQRQTVFLIERLQPDWLTDFQRRLYQFLSCALGGVFVGVLGGFNVGRLLGMEVGLTSGFLLMCGVSLSIAIVLGLVHYRIETVESLRWSWSKARNSIPSGIRVGLSVGIILVLGQLAFGLLHFNLISPTILYQGLGGMGTGLLFVLVKGLSGGGVETTAEPNQGIWKSFHNALLFGTIGTITLGIVGYTFGLSFFGMVVGLLFGLFSPAGLACYQHFILRIVLWEYGYIPWNYAQFMNYGTQLTFLQKVGGGYIFIHRYLLEFFAHKYIKCNS